MKKKKLLFLTVGFVGVGFLADTFNLPSKIMNGYGSIKEKVYDVFTTTNDEKIINLYDAIDNLSELEREKLISKYIVEDTIPLLDKLDFNQLDNLVQDIALSNKYTSRQKTDWALGFYDNIDGADKLYAVKEIGKGIVSLK